MSPGHRGTGAQGHRGTGAQGHRGTGAQGHRGTGAQLGEIQPRQRIKVIIKNTYSSSIA